MRSPDTGYLLNLTNFGVVSIVNFQECKKYPNELVQSFFEGVERERLFSVQEM